MTTRFISPGDIPSRSVQPVNNALHHLRHAFGLLLGEVKRNHWAVVGADALATEAAKKNRKVQKPGSVIPLLDAISRERGDIEEAKKLCERLLIDLITAKPLVEGPVP